MPKASAAIAAISATASAVSVAAVSAASNVVVASVTDSPTPFTTPSVEGSGSKKGGEKNKYKPRFDGLRFIETLVTAHR